MLYRTLKRMIERGQTEGLEEKIDIFFAVGKVTESEYPGAYRNAALPRHNANRRKLNFDD